MSFFAAWQFWVIIGGLVLLYLLMFVIDRRYGRRLMNRQYSEREMVLNAAREKCEAAAAKAEMYNGFLTERLKESQTQLEMLRTETPARDAQIRELKAEVVNLKGTLAAVNSEFSDLKKQLEEKKVIAKPQRPMMVLGIWPTPPGQVPLDQAGEADALLNAGFDYKSLRGPRANRAGVILEIDRVRPTIIQVGGHGTGDGTMLSDGIAEPGWWGDVVANKDVQLMVLLSCLSSQQDEINISDALVRVGVKAVISCDESIGDKDAVKYVQVLYAKLAEGLLLADANKRAKLAVSRAAGEMIRLREASS